MDLTNELIVQFAKLSNNKNESKKESLVYGTAVKYGDDIYVKMDGSDLLTPINITTDVQDGERVLVTVKEHNAIITGNLTNPSASTSTVNGISSELTNLGYIVADKADIHDLHATNAEIENLKVNKAEIEDLKVTNAEIENLKASTAEIGDLKANVAEIDRLLAGNISSGNIQTGGITGENLNMDTIIVRDANIESVSASKVNVGMLNTNLVDVQSESGNLKIKDNTIQIKDDTKVRVQIGKDATGDYSMSVWDGNGKLMFDARGLTSDAIKNEIIRNDMIAGDANISGGKLDIDSLITSVNQNGTSTLKSSKIKLDQQNQTLDVAFTTLKTQADDTKQKTESNTTQLGIAEGKINTLIQDTSIVSNGESLKLKDAYSKLEQTVGGISSVVGEHTTSIQDVSSKISSTNTTITQLSNQISSKVSSGDVQTLVKQNATSWGLSINGKLSGTNYNFDGTNFSIGTTSGTGKAYHSGTYSRWTHSDGSYTQAEAGGLKRYVNGTGHTYHYYSYAGSIHWLTTQDDPIIQLPSTISGKVGTNYSVMISIRTFGFDDVGGLYQYSMRVRNKTSTSFTIDCWLTGIKHITNEQLFYGWVDIDYLIIA